MTYIQIAYSFIFFQFHVFRRTGVHQVQVNVSNHLGWIQRNLTVVSNAKVGGSDGTNVYDIVSLVKSVLVDVQSQKVHMFSII